MRFCRRLHSFIVHPSTLVVLAVVYGGMIASESKSFRDLTIVFCRLFRPDILDIVLRGGLYFFAYVFLTQILQSMTDAIKASSPRATAPAYATESLDEGSYWDWVNERLEPWRSFLIRYGSLNLFPEVSKRFGEELDSSSTLLTAAKHQDLWMMEWLVQKAMTFSSDGSGDFENTKVFAFVSEALNIADEQDAWRQLMEIPNAKPVIAPVFGALVKDLVIDRGPGSQAYQDFVAWLES